MAGKPSPVMAVVAFGESHIIHNLECDLANLHFKEGLIFIEKRSRCKVRCSSLRCFKSEVCHMHLPRALRRNATVLVQVTSLKKLRAMAYRSKILHPSWIAPRQNHRRISIFDRIVDQKPSSIWFQNLLMRSSLLIMYSKKPASFFSMPGKETNTCYTAEQQDGKLCMGNSCHSISFHLAA